MRVYGLRHGETQGGARYWSWTDVPLCERGWRQMHTAVAGHSWDSIVSSPLRRCSEFAQALARALGAIYRCDQDLREMSFGEWEGRSAAELMQTDPDRLCLFWSDPSAHSPPGGESLAELQSRVMAAWRRIVSDRHCRRQLIVTHGGPLRVLRAAQSDTPLSALLSIDIPHAALIRIECLSDGSILGDPAHRFSSTGDWLT